MAYTINGAQFPSVSTILGQLDKSGALMGWALNCFEAKLNELLEAGVDIEEAIKTAKRDYRTVQDEALFIGSAVHDAIEAYIKTGEDLSGEMKPEVANGFIAFLEWESENVERWIESEVRTVNEHIGYAGTYDAIFENKSGEIVMVDFKTSKAVYDEYHMQVSAYKYARESLSGQYQIIFERGQGSIDNYDLPPIKIDKCAILRLDKVTGMPEYKERDPKKTEHDYSAFCALTNFYYQQKKRRLKDNPIVKNLWS